MTTNAGRKLLKVCGATTRDDVELLAGAGADLVVGDVDLVLPSGPSTVSRGVASHEYGHFAFCDMTYRADPGKFSSAWTNAAADTIASQFLGQDRSKIEDIYMNEAIADFFAAQTAGGMNYFRPVGSFNVKPDGTDFINWCGAPGSPLRCIEDNFGARPPGSLASPFIAGTMAPKQATAPLDAFRGQVARVSSTIHDTFDGAPNFPAADAPGNGAFWIQDPALPLPQQIDAPLTTPFLAASFFRVVGSLNDTAETGAGVIHEENIAVPGTAFPSVISEWLRREPSVLALLRQETFFRALTQVMVNAGGPPDEVCRLYDLHQESDVCPDWGPQGISFPPPPPLFVCPPNTTLKNGQCQGFIIP